MAATCWIMQPWWTSDLKCTRSARDRSRVPEVSHRSQTLWPELEVVSCLVAILHSRGWHMMTWCLTCPSCGVACTSIPVAETSPSQSIWSVFPVASFAMGAIDGHLWPQGHSTLMSIQRWTDGWENLCSVSWAWCVFNRRWHQIWICGMPSGWINHNHSPCGHDLLRATSVLFAQLAFWLDKARRFVEAAISHGGACKARSATEQDGLRGWEENPGKSIHIRQQSKILEEDFVRFVCIPGGSGFVSWTGDFFVGQLVLCLKSPSKRTRWQIDRPQRWGSQVLTGKF